MTRGPNHDSPRFATAKARTAATDRTYRYAGAPLERRPGPGPRRLRDASAVASRATLPAADTARRRGQTPHGPQLGREQEARVLPEKHRWRAAPTMRVKCR